MDARIFAQVLRGELLAAKHAGIDAVAIDSVTERMAALEGEMKDRAGLTTKELEEQSRRAWEKYLEDYRAYLTAKHDIDARMFDSVIKSGQSAARTLFVMTGGAALAILAFLGHLAEIRSDMVGTFGKSLLAFSIAAGAAGCVSVMTYLAQMFYTQGLRGKEWKKILGIVFHVLAIAAGLTAAIGFFSGLWVTYDLFQAF